MALQDLLIDTSPLRDSRPFRYAYAARTATVLVTGMLLVAASVQVYGLSSSSVAVATLNLLMALPMGVALIIGGVLADRIDRRKLMIWSRSIYVISTLIFLFNSLQPQPRLWPIYLAAIIGGAASGISIPAMMSSTPALVARDKLGAAAALSGLSMHLGSVIGPLLAGLLLESAGLSACYAVVLAGVVLTPLLLRALPPLPPLAHGSRSERGLLGAFAEGVRYLLTTPLMRSLLLIDLAAVIFATPLALLPEWADRILGLGSQATAALYAAPAVGAVLAALGSGWLRRHPRPGRAVIHAVLIWGVAIIALGLSPDLPLSLLALAIMGAADTVSKMTRMTLLQQHTPNHLLGRMSSLWMTQSSLGTAAGNLQMGLVSGAFGPAIALLAGGTLCLIAGTAFRLRDNALSQAEKPLPPAPSPH